MTALVRHSADQSPPSRQILYMARTHGMSMTDHLPWKGPWWNEKRHAGINIGWKAHDAKAHDKTDGQVLKGIEWKVFMRSCANEDGRG